ncbi:UTRA domain-containing protein [Actinoallomurus sp. CA-150999]|uniref:UTRA domain-containing protein n=1 Tax=Actinoallomurus sp. CA-150999 TaxID=3239887 RepID=UPI003D8D518D
MTTEDATTPPSAEGSGGWRPVRDLLDRVEADEPGEVTYVEQRPARSDIAELLGVPEGAPLVLRQRVVLADDEPTAFIGLWLDPDVAHATGLDRLAPAAASVRASIRSATGRDLGHVTEHLTARRATSAETKALGLPRNAPVLAVRATVGDDAGRRVLVVDLAFPGETYGFTDDYAL